MALSIVLAIASSNLVSANVSVVVADMKSTADNFLNALTDARTSNSHFQIWRRPAY